MRSTRQLHVTEEGKHYYYFCRKALDNLIDAENQLLGDQEEPSGTIRISVPAAFAHYRFTVEEALANGRLIEVLSNYNHTSRPFYLLYPEKKFQPLKLKVFINFLMGL